MSTLLYITLILATGNVMRSQNSKFLFYLFVPLSLYVGQIRFLRTSINAVAATATGEISGEFVKSRLENGRFVNSFNPQYKSSHLGRVLIWKITSSDNTRLPSNKTELDVLLPVIRHKKSEELWIRKPGIRFIWIGHASCFVQMNNFRFLVDPVFR